MKLLVNVMCMILGHSIIHTTSGAGAHVTTYTHEEEALQKLLPIVKDILTQKYMERNEFLIRFLRATHLDVSKAAKMIQKSMKWRMQNNIDGIIHEDIPIEKELPYTTGLDLRGHPTILVRAGKTDLRKVLISGKANLARRGGWKLVESLAMEARERNVTQIVGIVDLSGFSYRQHACRECIQFGEEMGVTIEANYPMLGAGVFLINTPRVFEVILSIIKAVLSESTKDVLHVFGFNKKEWTHALMEHISSEQLRRLFGQEFHIVPHPNEIQSPSMTNWTPRKSENFHQGSLPQKHVPDAESKATCLIESVRAVATLLVMYIIKL